MPRSHVRRLSLLLDRAAAIAWRLAPLGILVLAAVAYLWNLTVSGYANTYYSAAAQAASRSWSAMFFGAIDAAGFITIDKPPLSVWAMGLSVRLLGLSPFAVLLPQAIAGIAAVLLLWDAVRRQLGREAALLAGVAFALTPAAVLMFRYNNPDALLVLLLVAAAWALVRGLEGGALRWPLLAATFIGLAFLTKYLQAYLVLPAFALTWLVAAPGSLARRLGVLAASAATVAATSFWWVAIVDLIPAGRRPFIGGSTNNTALDLVLGYDGLGRILGRGEPGAGALGTRGAPGVGPGGTGGFGGVPGLFRLFNDTWAGQSAWLLPAAAAGLAAGLAARWRAPRTDRRRAAFLLWGAWAAVHAAVFSFMGGIVHPYYAAALAPAVAVLAAGGIVELWRARSRHRGAAVALGGVVIVTAVLAWQILARTPAFWPGIGFGAFVVAVVVAVVIVAASLVARERGRAVTAVALAVGLAAMLVGPALYSADTMGRAIAGGDPAPGPAEVALGDGRPPGGGAAGTSAAVADWLVAHQGDATWLVAVTSANQAAPLQLASGVPVMAMGGFMGTDPAPTLAQLQALVRDGSLRYVLLGGGPGGLGPNAGPGGFVVGDGRDGVAAERSAWVIDACTPVPAVSESLFDCAGAA